MQFRPQKSADGRTSACSGVTQLGLRRLYGLAALAGSILALALRSCGTRVAGGAGERPGGSRAVASGVKACAKNGRLRRSPSRCFLSRVREPVSRTQVEHSAQKPQLHGKRAWLLKRTCTLTRNAICCATRVAASPGLRARTSPRARARRKPAPWVIMQLRKFVRGSLYHLLPLTAAVVGEAPLATLSHISLWERAG